MDGQRGGLRKHSGVYCVFKFLRQFYNYDFRDYLLAYRYNLRWREFALPDSNAMNLSIYHKGPYNPDKVIYEIPLDTAAFGMCSQLMVMLNRINFAKTLGMTPCVNWYASNLYKEEQPVRGSTNIFEYYFKPINGISVSEAEQSRFVVYDDLNKGYGFDWIYIPMVASEYAYSEYDITKYAELYAEYFQLQKKIKIKIERGIKTLLGGKKVIGVHGRGGDLKLAFLGHAISVTGKEYAIAAEKAMRKIKADLVFLATDDLEILGTFQDYFGEKLVYYKDVVRSPGRVHNAMIKVDRPMHHYKLGFEILRDVYTLASCDGLITGLSTVNGMVRTIKRASGEEYEYMEIIDKGRRKTGINVNDPNFLSNDAVVVQKIKEIQERKELSESERMALVEKELDSVYGKEETQANVVYGQEEKLSDAVIGKETRALNAAAPVKEGARHGK